MRKSDLAQDIIDLIGLEAAVKFFETYGGMRVYVPKNISDTIKSRNELIRAECLEGVSPRRLSTKYNLHIKWITAICKKATF